jgi:hypothetical protein
MIEVGKEAEEAKKEIEKTFIRMQLGEEVTWKQYDEGITKFIESRIEEKIIVLIREELSEIRKGKLKASDIGFLGRIEKINEMESLLWHGVHRDLKEVRKAITIRDDISKDSENVLRFFRKEVEGGKGEKYYFYAALDQKNLDKIVEGIMRGQMPQIPVSKIGTSEPGMEFG